MAIKVLITDNAWIIGGIVIGILIPQVSCLIVSFHQGKRVLMHSLMTCLIICEINKPRWEEIFAKINCKALYSIAYIS